jgi:hypothetical protein
MPWAMARMHEAGVVDRVISGVHIGASCARHPLVEAAAWTLRSPDAVVGLLTAASARPLTDAFARGTWLPVPTGGTVPRSRTAALEVVQVAPRFIDPAGGVELGISTVEVLGVGLRLTDPDRTACDLWKSPRRVAAEHALTALRRPVESADFVLPRSDRLGRHLGLWGRIEPVVQGMMAR